MTPEKKQLYSRLFLIAVLAGSMIYLAQYLFVRAKDMRDVRRSGDMNRIVNALEMYNQQYGYYPKPTKDDDNGWDTSKDNSFLADLVEAKFLVSSPFDPTNDSNHYYRYRYFDARESGCRQAVAVLQAMDYEQPHEVNGRIACESQEIGPAPKNGFTWSSSD